MTQTDQLSEQINKAKKEYITDGYSMSIGEIVSMYKEGDLDINPDFQRKFRWSPLQQSRLVAIYFCLSKPVRQMGSS